MTFINRAYRPVATPDYIAPDSYLLPTYTPYEAHDRSSLSPRHGSDYLTYRTGIPEYEDYTKSHTRYKKDKDDERRQDIFGLPVLGGDEKGDGGFGLGSGLIGLLVGQLLPALLGGKKDGKEGGGLLGGLLG